MIHLHTQPRRRSYRDSEAYRRSDRRDADGRSIWPLPFAKDLRNER